MSKRVHIQRQLAMLKEIRDIMGAMKNMSFMESQKLARVLASQHRVLESIGAAAADFLAHHPEIRYPGNPSLPMVLLAIGGQRGFCGDFNEVVSNSLRQYSRQVAGDPPDVVVVGRRLAARVGKDVRVVAALDGPSVVEEVEPVLERVMKVLAELQEDAGEGRTLEVLVLAHREAEDSVATRSILPRPGAAGARRCPYPPLLNLPPAAFFSEMVRHYMWAQMHDVFYGSLMAENRRRLRHLEGAMQRIAEKCDMLQRRCNALRQEEITEEIEVIMLSSDALRQRPRISEDVSGQV